MKYIKMWMILFSEIKWNNELAQLFLWLLILAWYLFAGYWQLTLKWLFYLFHSLSGNYPNPVNRELKAAANILLDQRKKNAVLPPCDDKLELANRMGSYFVKKITDIGTRLDVMAHDLSTDSLLNCTLSPTPKFIKFTALSELEVQKLIEGSAKKSCSFDLMPTSLVFSCIDIPLPVITKMIDLSFVDGVFADV